MCKTNKTENFIQNVRIPIYYNLLSGDEIHSKLDVLDSHTRTLITLSRRSYTSKNYTNTVFTLFRCCKQNNLWHFVITSPTQPYRTHTVRFYQNKHYTTTETYWPIEIPVYFLVGWYLNVIAFNCSNRKLVLLIYVTELMKLLKISTINQWS